MTKTHPRRVLGIDPGSQHTGFAIVEDHGDHLACISAGAIRTTTHGAFHKRLQIIYQQLVEIIRLHTPQSMAVESIFHAVNAQSALKLGHARGVALLAAAECNLELFEYTPRAVKKGLTGSGAASKEQVQKMVQIIIKQTAPKSLDASDALAVAIYHCHLNPWLQRTMRYSDSNPSPWMTK